MDKIPENLTETKSTEFTSGPIIGEVVIGKIDPRSLSKEQFDEQQDVLYHGTEKEFSYSHLGKYDPLAGNGTGDFGTGFYATDNENQAENYSTIRLASPLEKPIVYNFLPFNAKMLDVRDVDNPTENGHLPPEFVQKWLKYLNDWIDNPSTFAQFGNQQEDMKKDTKALFLTTLSDSIKDKKQIEIRSNSDGLGIFRKNRNGVIGLPFRDFIRQLGYDGMIYREGGEGKNREDITSYVFYNAEALDTWEGWQKRK